MAEQFTPTEEQIARVLAQTGGDPRKMAIAYLRAQNRAKEANLAFGLMSDVTDMSLGIMAGDLSAVKGAADRAGRRNKAAGETA